MVTRRNIYTFNKNTSKRIQDDTESEGADHKVYAPTFAFWILGWIDIYANLIVYTPSPFVKRSSIIYIWSSINNNNINVINIQ